MTTPAPPEPKPGDRRIAACLNALARVPTKILESGIFNDVLNRVIDETTKQTQKFWDQVEMKDPIEINEYGQPVDTDESLKELFAKVDASTPAPPEPKPGDIWFKGYRSSADQRNLATRLRIALEDRTDGFVFRRATVEEIVTELERLQARVAELEKQLAAASQSPPRRASSQDYGISEDDHEYEILD